MRNGSEEVINAQIENEYFLATNVLALKVEEPGRYELTMKSKSFLTLSVEKLMET